MRRPARGWAAFALLCGAVLGHSFGSAWAGETVAGRPTVIDGDTLRVRDVVVGLHGVAAPGLDQTCETASGAAYPCGRRAARALSEHIGHAAIACEPRGRDAHHRLLAVCRLGGEDLNAWLVSNGLAVSERFKAADYFAHERGAWAKRRGLWAGVFADPTERKREDVALAPAPKPPAGPAAERRKPDEGHAVKVTALSK